MFYKLSAIFGFVRPESVFFFSSVTFITVGLIVKILVFMAKMCFFLLHVGYQFAQLSSYVAKPTCSFCTVFQRFHNKIQCASSARNLYCVLRG